MTKGGKITSTENLEDLASLLNYRMVNRKGGANLRLAKLLGLLTDGKDKQNPIAENTPKENMSRYSQTRFKFMLDAPFEISDKCCTVMKKNPARQYEKETGRKPITAQMASESRLRTQKWLQSGCNSFEGIHQMSNPMSFWTEQDVLHYIQENNLPLASVYGEIVPDSGSENIDGQIDFADLGLCDDNRPLKTTGCKRTGCMFCGFGCHLEKNPNRFEKMKETHPKQYEWIMKPWEQGGLGYKKVIDWINEHGNMNIKY